MCQPIHVFAAPPKLLKITRVSNVQYVWPSLLHNMYIRFYLLFDICEEIKNKREWERILTNKFKDEEYHFLGYDAM
jgi:hypothetical protein